MKLKQIIVENTDPISILKQNFNIVGSARVGPQGVDIDGDLESKEGKRISEIPVPLGNITGTLDLSFCGLTSLKNFPNRVGRIHLDGNKAIKSAATDHPVECSHLSFKNTGISDLSGYQFSNVKALILTQCDNLVSLDGTTEKIGDVTISDCPKFSANVTKYTNINTIKLTVDNNTKVPLVMPILRISDHSSKPYVTLLKKDGAEEIWKIISNYRLTGPEQILNLIRALRDKGFKEAARI